MNSFEFNKSAGAVLVTALLVFSLSELAGIIYHPHAPEKPGFAIEVAEAALKAAKCERLVASVDAVRSHPNVAAYLKQRPQTTL